MASGIDLYTKDFVERGFTRLSLFEELREKYDIKKVLYLGSYIHFTPSLVFPHTTYVDSFKKSKLIQDPEIAKFVNSNKSYQEKPIIEFIHQNYDKKLKLNTDYDLLISQYAGFVSQAGKQFLKKGGILVANNSHGDATMANLDSDFKLVAVANHSKDKWRISEKNLNRYFKRKDGQADTKTKIKSTMKGPGYAKTAANYIFTKLK